MTREEQLILSIAAIIVPTVTPLLLNKKNRRWIFNLPTNLGHWLKSCKCFYPTKIYLGKSEQANELAYVYVGKKRITLRAILWKPAAWIKTIWIRLRRRKFATLKPIPLNKLGVLQILAIYRIQRGNKPDWVDERFLVLDEILPMSTWQRFDELSGGVIKRYKNQKFEQGYRFRIPHLSFDKSGNRLYPDWYKKNVGLFPYSSHPRREIKSTLKDLKKKYKLYFYFSRLPGEAGIGTPKWSWREKSGN